MDSRDLKESFNSTARRFADREIGSPLLLAKYGLLLKFNAQTAEEKGTLAEALFDTALKCLEARTQPNFPGFLYSSDLDSMASLLKTLEGAESAGFIPSRAPKALADTGLKFVERAEAVQNANDRNTLADYARLCLEHAEKFQAIVDHRNEDISTSKNITPARRIVLKKDGG